MSGKPPSPVIWCWRKTGLQGALDLTGGGLDGTIDLDTRAGGQAFDVDVSANDARFGGDTPVAIRRATIDATGLIVGGDSTIEGTAYAEGLRYGNLFLGRLAARAQIRNGVGEATASIAGRRGSRFAMQMQARFDAERIAAIARGEIGGRRLVMPRRAVLTRQPNGGLRSCADPAHLWQRECHIVRPVRRREIPASTCNWRTCRFRSSMWRWPISAWAARSPAISNITHRPASARPAARGSRSTISPGQAWC